MTLKIFVTLDDIRGDLHMHTVASDGKCTIEEMALAAKKRGYQYIAICDHSQSSTIANGLSLDRMWKHIEAVREVDAKIKGITILGRHRMRHPERRLVGLPGRSAGGVRLGGGEHSLRHGEREKEEADAHGADDRRDGKPLHLGNRPSHRANSQPAGADGNRQWPRSSRPPPARTPCWRSTPAGNAWTSRTCHVRMALDAGVTLTINTDAHHTDQLDQMRFGVLTARRGGATKGSIVNCLTPAALKKHIARKRAQ